MWDDTQADGEREELEPKTTTADPEPDPGVGDGYTSAPETETDEAVATAAEPELEAEPDFVEKLSTPEQQMQDLTEKLRQTEDRLMRTMADFENYRRRAMKDKQEILLYAAERPLNEFLPIFDNLERAVAHAGEGNADSILEGVQMILNLFHQTLEKMEVKMLGEAGEPFDPNHHEAMQQMPDPEVPANHLVSVFQKGYMLRDRLVRPAKVVVSSGPPECEDAEGE